MLVMAVFGTGLTAIGTTVTLFVALWRVQGNRFDMLERHIDKRFEAVDKQFEAVDRRFEAVDNQFETADRRWTERFEMAERANRERFEMAEKASRERFEMAEKASRERSEAMDAKWTERLDAMDARWTERFDAMDRRFETAERQNQATHAAVCALNGRFDDLYRHLLGAGAPPAQDGQPGSAAG